VNSAEFIGNESGTVMQNWKVEKIAVIGPGIVGMPMAALLAKAQIKIGTGKPAQVVVVQRNSATSGWKIDAIHAGKSVIGGIEPGLDEIVGESVAAGLLRASHDYEELAEADVILVCVQTDKKGLGPDYGPLFAALNAMAMVLQHKPENKIPLIIFESTLAPSSMVTLIKERFKQYDLEEGKDILLGNSPNRVMPGRLLERVQQSDKLAGGLQPETPLKIKRLYKYIVTGGEILTTNSLTAEVVKTLENAYRDVRIAYAAEVVRYCDKNDIDFYQVREAVNKKLTQSDNAGSDPNAVPSGGVLIPTIGVGGHCLPKDGILLWWRAIESGMDTSNSLILKAREINERSPAETLELAELKFGPLRDKKLALLGAAYRFNSEDTRNSPTFVLANILKEKGYDFIIHDPYVKSDDQYLTKYNLQENFTRNLDEALSGSEVVILCTAHLDYIKQNEEILYHEDVHFVFDGCNIYRNLNWTQRRVKYSGIGRGENVPSEALIERVYQGFRTMETGLANELFTLTGFLNKKYACSDFQRIDFEEVRRFAASCGTGCEIARPGKVPRPEEYQGFESELVACACRKEEG